MPRTHRLVETRGVALGADRPGCGVVRTASGANVSLPGYLEIFTGRKTHCRDNHCARTELPTVLDEAAEAGLSPIASIGSWDMLDHAASRGDARACSSPRARSAGRARARSSRRELEELVAAGERADAFPGVRQVSPRREHDGDRARVPAHRRAADLPRRARRSRRVRSSQRLRRVPRRDRGGRRLHRQGRRHARRAWASSARARPSS